MKPKKPLTSRQWTAYYQKNAAALPPESTKPPANPDLPEKVRTALARSLPAWQLGETGEGTHLRAAAKKYSLAQHDPEFHHAVELFIKEEQRHGAALGDWLDHVGIPKKTKDIGDSLFRTCRYALTNYHIWATVVVMVELMAEIYYSTVLRITPCPRLKAECRQILQDEVHHIRFQCEHLAIARRKIPRLLRPAFHLAEATFFTVVCTAVWIGHRPVLSFEGQKFPAFLRHSFAKLSYARKLIAQTELPQLAPAPPLTATPPQSAQSGH